MAVAQRDREIIWRRFFFFESTLDRLSNEVCLDRRFRVFSACASTWNIRISKKPSISDWKKRLKKKRTTSFCFFYQFLEQIQRDMKLPYGSCCNFKNIFHFYFPISSFTLLLPHKWILSTSEQKFRPNYDLSDFLFKHALCLLLLLIRKQKWKWWCWEVKVENICEIATNPI